MESVETAPPAQEVFSHERDATARAAAIAAERCLTRSRDGRMPSVLAGSFLHEMTSWQPSERI
jgi:hypothetical protein